MRLGRPANCLGSCFAWFERLARRCESAAGFAPNAGFAQSRLLWRCRWHQLLALWFAHAEQWAAEAAADVLGLCWAECAHGGYRVGMVKRAG